MLKIEEIRRILPHRYPFLLVDRILEVEPGKRARGIKNVTFNEPCFTGHFPHVSMLPGVLSLEAMAQVAGVMLRLVPEYQKKLALFAGVDKVRFRRPVVPGDTLDIEVTMVKSRGAFGWVHGVGRVDGEIAVEGEMMFSLIEDDRTPGSEA
jgi:3-hydroxyacyl-[acyl-carrier-protein] dehydratase